MHAACLYLYPTVIIIITIMMRMRTETDDTYLIVTEELRLLELQLVFIEHYIAEQCYGYGYILT